jgi:hypothetical protein
LSAALRDAGKGFIGSMFRGDVVGCFDCFTVQGEAIKDLKQLKQSGRYVTSH